MPAHFQINDEALQRPALDTIHQVLTAPTEADDARRAGRPPLTDLTQQPA
jgi:hypothetical protein